MGVLVAKQSHFENIRGRVREFLMNAASCGRPGNCSTCNCGGCGNCGGPAGCVSRCDISNCNCGVHRFKDAEFGNVLEEFFSK